MNTEDSISRADLAVALKSAAERQARAPVDEHISMAQAERIAAEVGIAPAEFRAAVRALRSTRTPGGGIFGPAGVLSAESALTRQVSAAQATEMLAQAQFALATTGGTIENATTGLWRLSHRGHSLIQVTSGSRGTAMAVAVNRRLTRIGLLTGGTLVGFFAGVGVVGTILANAAVAVGGYSAVAVTLSSNVGMLAGLAAGALAGRAAWQAAARQTQESVLTALERMRAVAETEPGDLSSNSDQEDG